MGDQYHRPTSYYCYCRKSSDVLQAHILLDYRSIARNNNLHVIKKEEGVLTTGLNEDYEVPEAVVQYIHEKTGYPLEVIGLILRLERVYYGLKIEEK